MTIWYASVWMSVCLVPTHRVCAYLLPPQQLLHNYAIILAICRWFRHLLPRVTIGQYSLVKAKNIVYWAIQMQTWFQPVRWSSKSATYSVNTIAFPALWQEDKRDRSNLKHAWDFFAYNRYNTHLDQFRLANQANIWKLANKFCQNKCYNFQLIRLTSLELSLQWEACNHFSLLYRYALRNVRYHYFSVSVCHQNFSTVQWHRDLLSATCHVQHRLLTKPNLQWKNKVDNSTSHFISRQTSSTVSQRAAVIWNI